MRPTHFVTTALLAFLLIVATPALAQDGAKDLTLADIELGEQVSGERLSPHDLEGRVVVCFHWCVSCPISTGGFPFVNRLVEKYADRGVRVVGFQVRREPEVEENDVVWYLQHLKPNFPVVRLAWTCEWPTRSLPWAIVFDHEGKKIFANHLPGIEKVIDEALERAGDPVIGGPYGKLAELAKKIAADRAHIGRHLGEVRKLAAGGDVEAKAMLASVRRHYDGQIAKADEDVWGVTEEAAVYEDLAARFSGDELGADATRRLEGLRKAPGYRKEAAADAEFSRALKVHRRLPPPGGYIYHFTEMNYKRSDNPALHRRRSRMIAEFRLALSHIVSEYPGTFAALEAQDLLFVHEMPEIDRAGALARVARARKILAEKPTRYGFYDAFLLLHEVEVGYPAKDELAEAVKTLLAEFGEEMLVPSREAYLALDARAGAIQEEIRLGGSTLPRIEADVLVGRLREVAKQAGRNSGLAARVQAFVKGLIASYAGPAQLGVSFDRNFGGPGVRIGIVHPGYAAAKYGLRVGDIVIRIDGKEVGGMDALRAAFAGAKPEQTIEVTVRRGDATETLKVVLGRRV